MEKLKRKSKVISLEEAASWVKDGMTIAITGSHAGNAPNAFVREIVRRRVKDLTLIPSNSTGYQTDILLGAGCVKKLYSSYVGFDYLGMAPNFRRLAETGKLNNVDLCELGLLRALKAGQLGARFFALPDGIMACDNVRLHPEWYKIVKDPFTGVDVVVVPPLRSDIAVAHVYKCDPYGNAQEGGHEDTFLVSSADRVIITTEEVIPMSETQAHYKDVDIIGNIVDAVVEVPFGAHPADCHGGGYVHDSDHLREYLKSAKQDDKFQEYLEKYIYSCKNHIDYLDKIGMGKLMSLKMGRHSE